jgi:hypothetical protein
VSNPSDLYAFYRERIAEDFDASRISREDWATRNWILRETVKLWQEVEQAPLRDKFSSFDSPVQMNWRINHGFVRVLAQAYDRHPDYREEWRPSVP